MQENFLECPNWVIALLRELDRELRRVMWNMRQEEYDSPFGNTGNVFEGDVFKVRAYDWDGKEDINFEWKDMKFRWYKYLGRGTEVNGEWKMEDYVEMFNECLEEILGMEEREWER